VDAITAILRCHWLSSSATDRIDRAAEALSLTRAMALRTAFDSLDVTQRIVEFLPFDEVCGQQALYVGRFAGRRYFGRRCLKATFRGLRTAARRALTRGLWRPIRLLEEQGVTVVRQSGGMFPPRQPCPALLQKAWDADRGAALLVLMSNRAYDHDGRSGYSLGSRFLQLVEQAIPRDPQQLEDSDAFCRIMSGIEYAFGALRSGDLLFMLLFGWLYWHLRTIGSGPMPLGLTELFTRVPKELGLALASWANPRLAGEFVVACATRESWHHDEMPYNLVEYAKLMSAEWDDRAKASLFRSFLRSKALLHDDFRLGAAVEVLSRGEWLRGRVQWLTDDAAVDVAYEHGEFEEEVSVAFVRPIPHAAPLRMHYPQDEY